MIICVLGCEQVLGFELMMPGQVFGMVNVALAETGSDPPRYDVRIAAVGRAVSTTTDWGAVDIRTAFGVEEVMRADVVIVAGPEIFSSNPIPRWFRRCERPSTLEPA